MCSPLSAVDMLESFSGPGVRNPSSFHHEKFDVTYLATFRLNIPCCACSAPAQCFDVRYGKQRSWGAAGYGIAALLSGFVHDHTGGYWGVAIAFVVFVAIALVAASSVPVGATDTPAEGRDSELWYVKFM